MAAITPAGFQNHMQGPLANVLAAIMQGAFQNAREARQTDYQVGQDRQRQTDQDEDLAARAAAAGVDPTGMGREGIVAALAQVMQGREARSNQDAAADRASKQQLLNLRLDLDKRGAAREDADSKVRNLQRFSDMGDKWADNLGGVLKFLLGKDGSRTGTAPRPPDIKALGDTGLVSMDGKIFRLPKSDTLPVFGADEVAPGPQTGAPASTASDLPAWMRRFNAALPPQ